ncbi:MAG: hypothetical protein OXU45_04020 [Candidatus Melainabacteria bacterium]|nr:hypothetical protein [Candidatus Melainabacteria bacterium]
MRVREATENVLVALGINPLFLHLHYGKDVKAALAFIDQVAQLQRITFHPDSTRDETCEETLRQFHRAETILGRLERGDYSAADLQRDITERCKDLDIPLRDQNALQKAASDLQIAHQQFTASERNLSATFQDLVSSADYRKEIPEGTRIFFNDEWLLDFQTDSKAILRPVKLETSSKPADYCVVDPESRKPRLKDSVVNMSKNDDGSFNFTLIDEDSNTDLPKDIEVIGSFFNAYEGATLSPAKRLTTNSPDQRSISVMDSKQYSRNLGSYSPIAKLAKGEHLVCRCSNAEGEQELRILYNLTHLIAAKKDK